MQDEPSIMTELEDCDQCGRPAIKETSVYTHEYTKTCYHCGAVKTSTLEDGIIERKGYGSLTCHGISVTLFHDDPITFLKEHEVLKLIENDDSAVFLKWNEEEQCLVAIKGELPKTFEEMYQEQCNSAFLEQEYYSSIHTNESSPSESVSFNDRMVSVALPGDSRNS